MVDSFGTSAYFNRFSEIVGIYGISGHSVILPGFPQIMAVTQRYQQHHQPAIFLVFLIATIFNHVQVSAGKKRWSLQSPSAEATWHLF
jgi:hypothetical protein